MKLTVLALLFVFAFAATGQEKNVSIIWLEAGTCNFQSFFDKQTVGYGAGFKAPVKKFSICASALYLTDNRNFNDPGRSTPLYNSGVLLRTEFSKYINKGHAGLGVGAGPGLFWMTLTKYRGIPSIVPSFSATARIYVRVVKSFAIGISYGYTYNRNTEEGYPFSVFIGNIARYK